MNEHMVLDTHQVAVSPELFSLDKQGRKGFASSQQDCSGGGGFELCSVAPGSITRINTSELQNTDYSSQTCEIQAKNAQLWHRGSE
jgi:hypothetical protein